MRHLALAIAAVLSLALVAPAFAQPFADVPADHWAFDAIAELAAKGILEGFPDGTFKGDRAMTRYEMAMALARILARIEAIKIPPPPPPVKIPPPEVRRADIDRLTRLINEFRAELSALGVRITAVEEELAALKARLDNTKTTGFAMVRYQFPVSGPGGSGSWTLVNLTHTGSIGPSASATFRLVGGNVVAALVTPGATDDARVFFDRAQIDVEWFGLKWRAGRQTYKLGPVGLLFSECAVFDPCLGFGGLTVRGSFAPVSFEGAAFRDSGSVDLYMARGSLPLLPGWTLGVNYYTERHNFTSVTPNIANTGWSVDLAGTLIPGLKATLEYASFTPSGAGARSAWQVTTTWDLAAMFGITTGAPTLTLGYKSFGTAGVGTWTPLYAGSSNLIATSTNSRDLSAWNARLSLTISPRFRPYIAYESGTTVTTGVLHNVLEAGVLSTLAPNTTGRVRYQRLESPAGTVPVNRYRVEVWFEW
ncbi:MAG: S-layer homology domain-containing protein [Armatimonadota bacterium]|nr:S-layer homology domain-containing protein [Armatimonadota bacterium]MDR7473423.1 S-layer homology domain-containing protein [Armatimonadota bacterium]